MKWLRAINIWKLRRPKTYAFPGINGGSARNAEMDDRLPDDLFSLFRLYCALKCKNLLKCRKLILLTLCDAISVCDAFGVAFFVLSINAVRPFFLNYRIFLFFETLVVLFILLVVALYWAFLAWYALCFYKCYDDLKFNLQTWHE